MLRELMVIHGATAPTQYKASAKTNTGCPVVVNYATGTFQAPTEETVDNLFFVDKERYATGVYAGITNLSDYEDQFNVVDKNACGKLCAYDYAGDVFATSEYDTESITEDAVGKRVAAVNGKLAVATKASKYQFAGFVTDNGHTLAKIVVCDSAVANA